ncbi:imidazole glycerol phosphate synthase subunit HisH [Acidovorax lacteus]
MYSAYSVTIVDYGMGNLWSVANALRFLGCEPRMCGDPQQVCTAPVLVLPGVGSFRRAMQALDSRGLSDALREAVQKRDAKLLGICLGMQLLAERGSEDGVSAGLGLVPGQVDRFEAAGIKVPHVGFNSVHHSPGSRLFAGVDNPADFYFVHSFRLSERSGPGLYARTIHGEEFVSAYEHGNVFGTQFHPEKSQTNGLRLLRNFLAA